MASSSDEESTANGEGGVVVVVDDEPLVLRTLVRSLDADFEVAGYASAEEAIERVRRGGVRVVLSDIKMPGMSGFDLLRAVRRYDPDLPVVLVTGAPSPEAANRAVEYGAFRCLAKPFDWDDLHGAVTQAATLYQLARVKRAALELEGRAAPTSERVGLEVTFERALGSLSTAYQPIVSVSGQTIVGYEVLLRSGEPSLPGPLDVLGAAERLGALDAVGRLVRRRAAEAFGSPDGDTLLFVNVHPHDLMDPDLSSAASPLAALAPRVVLEITERASLAGIDEIERRVAALRQLGFRIAIDDLGAGYAGLSSFALLEPEIVKIDMSLARDVDQSPIKQKLVESLGGVCREMGMMVVVEGVETLAERDALIELGCDLLQGYLFARPNPSFPPVHW